MMQKGLFGLSVLLLSLLLMPPAQAATISIAGSTTVLKYIQLAANRYQQLHPDTHFTISGGGSTNGFAQMADGRVEIGMMSRDLRANERQVLDAAHVRQVAVALDAVVPVVSAELYAAGLHSISRQQLADIYRGKLRNWQQLAGQGWRGPDRPILVVDKNSYHGTRAVFADYVLGENRPPNRDVSIVLDGDRDILRLLQSSDQAIAYVGIAFVSGSMPSLKLRVDGHLIAASEASIRRGTYPMARRLYLLLPEHPPAAVAQFLRFILSREGQALVGQAGYLSLRE